MFAMNRTGSEPRQGIARTPLKSRLGVFASLLIVGAVLIAWHLVIRSEGTHWASPLRLGDWLFNLALALTLLVPAWAAGTVIARPLLGQADDPLGDLLAALGIGVGALSLLIFAAGLLHLLYSPLFLAGGIALFALLYRPGLAAGRAQFSDLRAWAAQRPDPPLSTARRVVIVVQAITLLFVCLRNTIPLVGDAPDQDGVTYHLPGPALYLQAHYMMPLPDIPLTNGPSGLEMLAIPGLMADTDTLLKMLNLLFALLLGLATYAFCKRHFPEADARLGVTIFFLPNWIVELMAGTVVDFATAFLLLLGVSDALAWLNRQDTPGAANPMRAGIANDRLLIRAGLLMGLAVSFKLTSGPGIPAAIIVLGAYILIRGKEPILVRVWIAGRAGVLLGVAAVLPVAPWLLKNRIWFHNMLYPAANLDNGGNCTVSANGCTAIASGPGSGALANAATHLWWTITTTGSLYWNFLGPMCLAILILPALRATRPALCFLVVGAALWLWLVPLFYPPRYWIAMVAMAAALCAVGLGEIRRRCGLGPRLFDTLLVLFLLPASLFTLLIAMGLAQRSGAFDLATGKISPYTFLADRVRPYRAIDWVNTHTSPGTEIAMVNSSMGYYLHRPYLNDWYGTRFQQLEGGGAARRADLAQWCATGVRYVVFNHADHEYNADLPAGIHPLAHYAWTRIPGLVQKVAFSWRGVDVLAVSPCQVGGSTASP
jgi:hypothetical protein